MSRSSRSDKFVHWLKDLTPEKVNLLVSLERAGRLVSHVKHLTGSIDEKLVLKMVAASEELRTAYEPIVLEENEKDKVKLENPG